MKDLWPRGINQVKFNGGHIVGPVRNNHPTYIHYFNSDDHELVRNLDFYIKTTANIDDEEEEIPSPRKGFEMPYNFGIFEECPDAGEWLLKMMLDLMKDKSRREFLQRLIFPSRVVM